MPDMLTNARAELLFASDLPARPYDPAVPTDVAQIGTAIRDAVRRCGGLSGCVACLAFEYGAHPDTAVARMLWAIGVVHDFFPHRHPAPTRLDVHPHHAMVLAA
jgi:hypothetical protein